MGQAAAFGALSRRSLLKSGAIGVLVLGLSAVGLALQKTRLLPLPSAGLRALSPEQYAILSAIAQRLCPPASSEAGKPAVPGAGPDGVDVALLIDRLIEHADDDVRGGVALALGVVESALPGALFGERLRPFTTLSAQDQDRVLLSFRRSRVGARRVIFRSLAGLTASLYYGDPRAWPSIGYPGPPSPSGLRAAYPAELVDWNSLRAKV